MARFELKVGCVGKHRGEHPLYLIATLTDSRRDVRDKADFLARATADIAKLAEQNNRPEQDPAAFALAMYESATRIGWIETKTRLTADHRSLYETRARGNGLNVEETRYGRYFHFKCHSCGRRADWTEERVTRLMDALRTLGRKSVDLSELA
jgi:hypothetical protein